MVILVYLLVYLLLLVYLSFESQSKYTDFFSQQISVNCLSINTDSAQCPKSHHHKKEVDITLKLTHYHCQTPATQCQRFHHKKLRTITLKTPLYHHQFTNSVPTIPPPQKNSHKSVKWSAVPVPAWVGCDWSWRGSRAAASKGSITYAFTHMGNFLLLLLLLILCPSPHKSQSRGLLAEIWTSRLRFGPQGWDLGIQHYKLT